MSYWRRAASDWARLLVELGLRQQLPIEQHLRALEIGLREVVGGLGVGHFGHAIDLERVRRSAVPSRASICAALASASWACARTSTSAMRTSSLPSLTRLPRSTGVATTRPAISAATSACSSAVSVPVTATNRVIGRSTAAAVATAIAVTSVADFASAGAVNAGVRAATDGEHRRREQP